MDILDRSVRRAPSCLLQLTDWQENRAAIQFAIDQLDKHHAPWQLKSNGKKVAVFVPGNKEGDDGRRDL